MKLTHHHKKIISTALIGIVLIVALIGAYHLAYANKIYPEVRVGEIKVGGLTPEQAHAKLAQELTSINDHGITVNIQGTPEVIKVQDLNLTAASNLSDPAWQVGRSGSWLKNLGVRLAASAVPIKVSANVEFDNQGLTQEISNLAALVDQPGRDIRLSVQKTTVNILTDIKAGRILDQNALKAQVAEAISNLDSRPINVSLQDDLPKADPSSAESARVAAQKIIATPLRLIVGERVFYITSEQIGLWITSEYQGNQLVPSLNREAISTYITTIASQIDVKAQKPGLKFDNGKVVEFVPPKTGQVLQQTASIDLIVQALMARQSGTAVAQVTLPVKSVQPDAAASSLSGVVELIGHATTPFTGSPTNRIHNIKNGVSFLSGLVVQPGEEFSTLRALGTIDNTSGYLPELVIKGDVTTPEFGGGLCQVSTTLFRAVLDAGLPVTARRNHSYRVSYYEKDGTGKFIGPGLDATIYEPDLDFKFKNDTSAPILIYAYTVGDRATFELYGTKDGRTAHVNGPIVLSETPPGPPIYTETDTLAKGTVKQVETAHPGGSAVATYTVTYPDGHQSSQTFNSYYRRWPARYLVGTK